MKRLISSIVVVAVALAFAPLAQAAKPGKGGGKGQSCAGTVESVDATANTITVKTDDGSKTFKVAADAKLPASGLAGLKAGQEVTVRYSGSGDALEAQGIMPKGGKGGGKKKN
jgi:Cu/Ag efflux protein CusF